MSNIESYESAKAVIADIDARKDSVLQAFKKSVEGYGLYIKELEFRKGCLSDVLNDTFYEVEQEAKAIIEQHETAEERHHRMEESVRLLGNAFSFFRIGA